MIVIDHCVVLELCGDTLAAYSIEAEDNVRFKAPRRRLPWCNYLVTQHGFVRPA